MKLTLGHVNIRSISANFPNFREYLLTQNYHVFGLTEIWVSPHFNINLLAIPGYTFCHIPRRTRGGGVGIYVRNNINFSVVFRDIRQNIEQVWIRFRLQCRIIIVGVVYRPGNDIPSFISEFENSLSSVVTLGNEIFCLGDFNINAFNLFGPAYSSFTTCLESFSLRQLITDPTRVTPYSSTLIDFVIAYMDTNVLESGVRDVHGLADHSVVYCIVDLEPESSAPVIRTYRDYTNFSMHYFQQDLISMPWNEIIYLQNIDDKVTFFNQIMTDLFDRHAPFITRSFHKPFEPWHTDNISMLMRRRDNARRRYDRTGDLDDLNYYRQLRNYTTYLQRHEKKCYLQHCLNSGDSKQLWSNLKKFGIQSKNIEIPEHMRDEHAINDSFLASQDDNVADLELLHYYNNNIHQSVTEYFEFILTSEDEIFKVIASIKSTAVGADGIGLKMLTLCCPFVVKYLCHIFNTCLLHHVFPSCWKQSFVIPIPKRACVTDHSDLRPISILPLVSKIFEKILSSQLTRHIQHFNILPKTQSGFRRGYSCTSALTNITDDILRNADEGSVTALVLLDFSKAFDTINHDLLLSILRYIGLGEGPVALFESYIKDRYQKVVISNISSDYAPVRSGVPQGSVLGPLLFSIYTARFAHSVTYSKIHMYADDTQICHAINSQNVAESITELNTDVNNLADISMKHNLKLNAAKSSIIFFGNKISRTNISANSVVAVNNTNIPVVKTVKNLGVYFDSDLRFKVHVTKCLQHGYSTLKLLFSNRHLLNQNLKKILCDSLVLSRLNYCDAVYHHCLDSVDSRRIQVLQNSCLRFTYGFRRREHVTPFLLRSGWLCMRDRRLLHVTTFYHKILTEKTPPYLYDKITFRTDVHNINIRHKHVLTIPTHKLQLFKRSFSYTIANIYNKISFNLKSLTILSFKKRLKCLLLEKEIVI